MRRLQVTKAYAMSQPMMDRLDCILGGPTPAISLSLGLSDGDACRGKRLSTGGRRN